MNEIRFIDLFSGIGGFRKGLQQAGGYKHVWSNDFNKYANQIYTRQFGEENHNSDDIRGVDPEEIPDFDLLCAGFPCQSFSVAGKRKGFKETRGTLFFEILRIAAAKRPSLLLLENVKGLLNHDGGRTFTVILQSLDDLGYWIEWQVLNSKHFGVPQNRQRVFIIGHLRGSSEREIFPIKEVHENCSQRVETESGGQVGATLSGRSAGGQNARGNYVLTPRDISTTLDANYWKGPDKHDARTVIIHRGYETMEGKPRIYEDISPTIPTPAWGGHIPEVMIYRHPLNYGKKSVYATNEDYPTLRTVQRMPKIANTVDTSGWLREMGRHEIGKHGLTDYRIRRLTPIECERLQGFPDGWTEFGYVKDAVLDYEPIYGWKEKYDEEIDEWEEYWTVVGKNPIDPITNIVRISDTQRYKALGNAVTVNVIQFLGERIKESFGKLIDNKGRNYSPYMEDLN